MSVLCLPTERPRFLGNPAFSRSRVDESGVGGVVMSSPMNHTGLLVSWTAFVSMPGTLSLFLLRPVGGRNDTYTIVDVNVFALTSVGQHTSYLDNTDTRIVYAGDRIGLTFRDTNPIPYDVMPLGCKGTPHFNLYRVSIEIGDGDVMLSPSDVVQPGCRLYSLYASVHSIGEYTSLYCYLSACRPIPLLLCLDAIGMSLYCYLGACIPLLLCLDAIGMSLYCYLGACVPLLLCLNARPIFLLLSWCVHTCNVMFGCKAYLCIAILVRVYL